jgi:N6-adenosine-specific RNA methylase IME4
MDTTQLGTDFLGVLLNPPWHAHVTPAHLAALQLDRVCPLGFIFVWVEKEVLSEVMDVFAKAKYQYVENLTWVQMTPANRVRAHRKGRHNSQAGRG